MGLAGEGPADGGQVLRRGVEAAGAQNAQAVHGQGGGIGPVVDRRPAVKAVARGVGLFQTGGL